MWREDGFRRQGSVGQGRVIREKWGQLQLNNKKILKSSFTEWIRYFISLSLFTPTQLFLEQFPISM